MNLRLPSDRALITCQDLAQAAVRSEPGGSLAAVGAGGCAMALVLRALARETREPLVAVTRSAQSAEALVADLRHLGLAALRFDPGEQSPYAERAPDRRAAHQRLATLFRLASLADDAAPPIIVLPPSALVQRVVPAQTVRAQSVALEVTGEIGRDRLLRQLADAGYLRVPLVEDPGTVGVRGALLDVWSPGEALPFRIELDGDLIESIKRFNPDDQRSRGELERVWLVPAREGAVDDESVAHTSERMRALCDAFDWPSSKTRSLIEDVVHGRAFFGAEGFLPAACALEPLVDQLPAAVRVVVEEPSAVADAIDAELARAEADEAALVGRPHFPVDAFYAELATVEQWLSRVPCLSLLDHPIVGDAAQSALRQLALAADDTPSLSMQDQQELSRALEVARKSDGHAASLEPLVERVRAWQEEGLRVVVSARASTQAERLGLMLENRDLEVRIELEGDRERWLTRPRGGDEAREVVVVLGPLARGVVAPGEGMVLITEEEVFGSRAHRRRSKPLGKRRKNQLLDDLRSLLVGEYVVHSEHGIGRYLGLEHRNVAGNTVDLLAVEYAGGDKLYVPVYRLNLIHKFRGSEGQPKLDRLGGQSFARSKSRAKKRVRIMADELLRLYAEREAAVGQVTPPIDDEYRAFEASFAFEETEDQASAIAEVAGDLERERPMDRLVCGDVGFGKTEIALRAAFRVAMSGRQVAVLCPTTVLAQQHRMTFESRLARYAIEVAMLSRFVDKRRSQQCIRGLKDGTIDVVIGTHRILSKDVHFKNLGLLVVDEEQRFGVAAKERIKALRTNVDVLTLSATPIPRTLQMAVSGLRDLSIMTTPPTDRRAVRTIVTRHDRSVLREAIERELSRGGQVFFVYNRIGGLEERAAMVHELVPDARIAVAHGRMGERSLEKTMLQFVAGELDVLVTTAIIENGLDIPRANTIIVDRAEMLGMGQLYQLRGRVGRSKERAYCYLVLPPGGSLNAEAKARIEALQRYSDLGSGFQIASLDLDLRGAGELLGAEQSGTVAAVGFEMFCEMLQEALSEAKGEPVAHDVDTELSFDVEALLPEDYIADVGVRLGLYKRLASALDAEEVQELSAEMQDRFGRPPPPARRFVHLMTLKTELRALEVLGCEASAKAVTLHLRDDTPLDAVALTKALASGELSYKLTPDMRLTRRSAPGEIFPSGLEATDRLLSEIQRFVKR